MALETGTYISDLVATNPTSADAKSQGDDHIRLLKATIKATFPSVTGAVTKTHTELNTVTDRVLRAGDTYAGTHNFTGATVTVATPTLAAHPVTKSYADGLAFASALPAQTGNSGKFVTTDGTTASWADALPGNQEVHVSTGNGHGSTNTAIRRFTTTVTNTGTAVTYADSAALGATFTINETGIYALSYVDNFSGGQCWVGISVNSAQLTTSVANITAANRLTTTRTASGVNGAVTRVVRLTAGDVIRAHTDGTPDDTSARCFFSIRKIGVA